MLITVTILSNLGSALTIPLIYLDFEVRRMYIENALCINRDKPITMCHGKCYLDEQLDKAQKQQEEQDKATPIEIAFFFKEHEPLSSYLSNRFLISNTPCGIFIENRKDSLLFFGIFHPPRLV